MNRPMKKSRHNWRTLIYIYVLIALLILLVTSSYTWFAISQTPRVSDMALYINAPTGLELATSYNAPLDDWGQSISFLDLVDENAPLRPITWSDEQKTFLAIRYGIDGRMAGRFETLTDEANANRTDNDGYYVVGTFYAKTDETCTVSLADAISLGEGKHSAGTYVIGTPIWNDQEILHYNGGFGAETAVRIGFMATKIDPELGTPVAEPIFSIYEPNCNRHIDSDSGYIKTPSVDGKDSLTDNLILQTSSVWTEAFPVEQNVTVKILGEFLTETKLFTINAGELYQIKLYIWLEGQDVDCINAIDNAQMIANVQFKVDYTGHTGLEEIENEK